MPPELLLHVQRVQQDEDLCDEILDGVAAFLIELDAMEADLRRRMETIAA